jgi:hypothetical protein
MLVLLVAVQMALWARAAQVADLAASEGVGAAMSIQGGPAAGVARARSVLSASGSDIESSLATARLLPGDQVGIQVTGRAVTVLPWISLPVTATRLGPIQEFRASE